MTERGYISREDLLAWLREFAAAIEREKDRLTELDAAIGDADHGENLSRGMQAVLAVLPAAPDGDAATLVKRVGMTLISTIGGASGPLYGTFFLQFSGSLSGKTEIDLTTWAIGFGAGVDGVARRGKASVGDKTMLDALLPAKAALDAAVLANQPLAEALDAAAGAAEAGAAATIPLVARKGRASYLAERSAGHQDPGATSAALLVRSAANVVNRGR